MGTELWTELCSASWAWLRLLGSNTVLATLVFVVVLVICRLIRRDRPALRHALWLLVLIRLVLPPQLGHSLAIGELAADALSLMRLATGLHPSAPAMPPAEATVTLVPSGAAVSLPPPVVAAWSLLVAAAWLVGCVTVALLLARRRSRYRRLVRSSPRVHDPALLAMAEHWRQRLGIRRRVSLRTGTAQVSPFTTGVIRPVVFIPDRVLALADQHLVESVIAHELTHVARLDGLWLWLQHALQAVYFFNPVVWLSASRLEQERERLADAAVLDHPRISAKAYASNIVQIIELGLKGAEAPALSPRARRIHMRLRSILRHKPTRKTTLFAETAAVVVLALFLLPMARSNAAPAPGEPAVVSTQQGTRTATARVEPASRLTNPLPEARISLAWGMMRDPFTHKVRLHEGIDLAAATGTPILAAADGTVVHAANGYKDEEAWGLVVVIDHGNGLETVYAHLGKILVEPGHEVTRGDTIARVGSTGRSTGPHLHFAVFKDGSPQDPATWVSDW